MDTAPSAIDKPKRLAGILSGSSYLNVWFQQFGMWEECSAVNVFPKIVYLVGITLEALQTLAFAVGTRYGYRSEVVREITLAVFSTVIPIWDTENYGDVHYIVYTAFVYVMVAVCLLTSGLGIALMARQLENSMLEVSGYVGLAAQSLSTWLYLPLMHLFLAGLGCSDGHVHHFPEQECHDAFHITTLAISIIGIVVLFAIGALMTSMMGDVRLGAQHLRARPHNQVELAHFLIITLLVVTHHLLVSAGYVHAYSALVMAGMILTAALHSYAIPFYQQKMNNIRTATAMATAVAAAVNFVNALWEGDMGAYPYGGRFQEASLNSLLMFMLLPFGALLGYAMGDLRPSNELKGKLKNLLLTGNVPRHEALFPFPRSKLTHDLRFAAPRFQILETEILSEYEDVMMWLTTHNTDRLGSSGSPTSPRNSKAGSRNASENASRQAVPNTYTSPRKESDDGSPLRYPRGYNREEEALEHERRAYRIATRSQIVVPYIKNVRIPLDAEVATRFVKLQSDVTGLPASPYVIAFTSRIFIKALLLWKTSGFIKCAFANFLFSRTKRLRLALDLIDEVDNQTDVEQDAMVLYISHKIGQEIRDLSGIRDSVRTMSLNRAKHWHKEALADMGHFWAKLMESRTDLVGIAQLCSQITNRRIQAQFEYERYLLTQRPDAAALGMYAAFLDNVIGDDLATDEFKSLSRDAAEEKRSRLMKRGGQGNMVTSLAASATTRTASKLIEDLHENTLSMQRSHDEAFTSTLNTRMLMHVIGAFLILVGCASISAFVIQRVRISSEDTAVDQIRRIGEVRASVEKQRYMVIFINERKLECFANTVESTVSQSATTAKSQLNSLVSSVATTTSAGVISPLTCSDTTFLRMVNDLSREETIMRGTFNKVTIDADGSKAKVGRLAMQAATQRSVPLRTPLYNKAFAALVSPFVIADAPGVASQIIRTGTFSSTALSAIDAATINPLPPWLSITMVSQRVTDLVNAMVAGKVYGGNFAWLTSSDNLAFIADGMSTFINGFVSDMSYSGSVYLITTASLLGFIILMIFTTYFAYYTNLQRAALSKMLRFQLFSLVPYASQELQLVKSKNALESFERWSLDDADNEVLDVGNEDDLDHDLMISASEPPQAEESPINMGVAAERSNAVVHATMMGVKAEQPPINVTSSKQVPPASGAPQTPFGPPKGANFTSNASVNSFSVTPSNSASQVARNKSGIDNRAATAAAATAALKLARGESPTNNPNAQSNNTIPALSPPNATASPATVTGGAGVGLWSPLDLTNRLGTTFPDDTGARAHRMFTSVIGSTHQKTNSPLEVKSVLKKPALSLGNPYFNDNFHHNRRHNDSTPKKRIIFKIEGEGLSYPGHALNSPTQKPGTGGAPQQYSNLVPKHKQLKESFEPIPDNIVADFENSLRQAQRETDEDNERERIRSEKIIFGGLRAYQIGRRRATEIIRQAANKSQREMTRLSFPTRMLLVILLIVSLATTGCGLSIINEVWQRNVETVRVDVAAMDLVSQLREVQMEATYFINSGRVEHYHAFMQRMESRQFFEGPMRAVSASKAININTADQITGMQKITERIIYDLVVAMSISARAIALSTTEENNKRGIISIGLADVPVLGGIAWIASSIDEATVKTFPAAGTNPIGYSLPSLATLRTNYVAYYRQQAIRAQRRQAGISDANTTFTRQFMSLTELVRLYRLVSANRTTTTRNTLTKNIPNTSYVDESSMLRLVNMSNLLINSTEELLYLARVRVTSSKLVDDFGKLGTAFDELLTQFGFMTRYEASRDMDFDTETDPTKTTDGTSATASGYDNSATQASATVSGGNMVGRFGVDDEAVMERFGANEIPGIVGVGSNALETAQVLIIIGFGFGCASLAIFVIIFVAFVYRHIKICFGAKCASSDSILPTKLELLYLGLVSGSLVILIVAVASMGSAVPLLFSVSDLQADTITAIKAYDNAESLFNQIYVASPSRLTAAPVDSPASILVFENLYLLRKAYDDTTSTAPEGNGMSASVAALTKALKAVGTSNSALFEVNDNFADNVINALTPVARIHDVGLYIKRCGDMKRTAELAGQSTFSLPPSPPFLKSYDMSTEPLASIDLSRFSDFTELRYTTNANDIATHTGQELALMGRAAIFGARGLFYIRTAYASLRGVVFDGLLANAGDLVADRTDDVVQRVTAFCGLISAALIVTLVLYLIPWALMIFETDKGTSRAAKLLNSLFKDMLRKCQYALLVLAVFVGVQFTLIFLTDGIGEHGAAIIDKAYQRETIIAQCYADTITMRRAAQNANLFEASGRASRLAANAQLLRQLQNQLYYSPAALSSRYGRAKALSDAQTEATFGGSDPLDRKYNIWINAATQLSTVSSQVVRASLQIRNSTRIAALVLGIPPSGAIIAPASVNGTTYPSFLAEYSYSDDYLVAVDQQLALMSSSIDSILAQLRTSNLIFTKDVKDSMDDTLAADVVMLVAIICIILFELFVVFQPVAEVLIEQETGARLLLGMVPANVRELIPRIQLYLDTGELTDTTNDPGNHPINDDIVGTFKAQWQRGEEVAKCFALLDSDQAHGYVVITANGTVEHSNESIGSLLGYPKIDLVGLNVSVLMEEPFRSQHNGYIQRYLTHGNPRIMGVGRDTVAQAKNGARVPVFLQVFDAVRDDGTMHFIAQIDPYVSSENRVVVL